MVEGQAGSFSSIFRTAALSIIFTHDFAECDAGRVFGVSNLPPLLLEEDVRLKEIKVTCPRLHSSCWQSGDRNLSLRGQVQVLFAGTEGDGDPERGCRG